MNDDQVTLPDPAELRRMAATRPEQLRGLAAELAKGRRPAALEPLFAEPPQSLADPGVELRACVLGELALMGGGSSVGRSAVLDAYAVRLGELGHPLAWLPGARLDVEHRFGVRVRGALPVKTADQLRARFPEVPGTGRGAVAGAAAREIQDAERTRAAGEAFVAGGWARVPEARFFELAEPVTADDFGLSLLTALPLDCLAGEGRRAGRDAACRTAVDDVANTLYAAAANGGVNGLPQYGAYSRLYAWRGLYALLGEAAGPAGTPPMEAVLRAAEHRWLRFVVYSDWFQHDTADVGFAVLDPGGRRVAVLAATDTGTD
ncbi:DUF6183 family protein [Actinomycetota bacterium Odt1-20B]